ncbi:MAG: multi-sensor hybrid histidine kinase [Chitinophagaceae bacterium]|nr:multi-sensor hybrid histidine kinase [Chitinophagaceae bacterium]
MEKLENKSVLIVDDDARNMFALRSYLETLDMKITMAENGEEAISGLQGDTKPDIILLDMMMPVMNGYETLSVLEKNDSLKDIPVIAITARAMKGDKEKCLEAGAWDYISKPIDLDLLVDKLTKWTI